MFNSLLSCCLNEFLVLPLHVNLAEILICLLGARHHWSHTQKSQAFSNDNGDTAYTRSATTPHKVAQGSP